MAFSRDKLGRVTRETINGREVTSTYDCCGNRVSRNIGGRLVESSYDPLGVLKSLTIGNHQPLAMTLDPLGRELKRESAAGFRLEQSYDIIGQLTGQIAGLSIASFGKGLEGAMAAQKLGIDPQKMGAQVERAYQWNKAFEPLQIGDKRWGSTDYAYDANGQIGETSFGDGSKERFHYDGAMNIVGFGADDIAQRFEPWLSKRGGAITEAKGPKGERIELKYDNRNRVVERRVQQNGFRLKVWKYEWDAKDRLIATTTPEGERWTYGYDPFGRRVHKINSAAAKAALKAQAKELSAEEKNRGAYYEDPNNKKYPTKGGKIIVGTSYLWDGNVIAEEADMLGDGSADWDNATRWHYEPNSFRPIAKETQDDELFYIVTDHLGTPREMFSEDGHLAWAAQYRTWGVIKHIWTPDNDNDQPTLGYPPSGSANGNLAVKYNTIEAQAAQTCPIRFQGQWEDVETGLYYNRFRIYDPLAGQYLSPDPIGLAGGLRPLGYVHNPSAWIDPWGLAACCKVENPSGLHKAIEEQYGHKMSSQEMRNIQDTVDRIKSGKTNPRYYQDGTIYNNSSSIDQSSSILHTGTNYREYVVPTPNIGNAGARRIVYDTNSGRMYYTHDHYKNFIEINPTGW